MRKNIITILLALVTIAGQSQIKCHIEGEVKDQTQGATTTV